MRLIDVDALLETMENFFTKAEDEARYAGRRGAEVTWNDAVYMIKTASTIEPERPTGKWITQEFGSWAECSECHELYDIPIAYSNFCPNCGAKME